MAEIRVKVADHAVAGGSDVLATIGLGSCVAITVYDRTARIGGMAHVLLPTEAMSRDTSNRAKFASTAVPLLVEELRARGAHGPYVAKIAGGASMFAQLMPNGGINMGERNIEAVRQALVAARIPLAAEDVGGDYGRSVYLHPDDGRVLVKSLRRGDRVL